MLSTFFYYGGLGMLALRLGLGAIFLAHGWPKIKSLKQTAVTFDGMGFKPGALWGTIAALLEFFGGIALILGFFTPLVAVLFAGQFAVIVIWKIKKGQPFAGGWEFDLLILVAVLALAANGAGGYSLDRLFFLG